MRVISLKKNPRCYTCNAYLVLGDCNRLQDLNTLIDVGSDDYILEEIDHISTGVGKQPLEQVVLTHSHFDHASGLAAIKKRYGARVHAFEQFEGVDVSLHDGEKILIGDREFEVIHVAGHSDDSVCFYCKREKVLFSGDAPLFVNSPGGTYEEKYIDALEKLAAMDIERIYSGHDTAIGVHGGNIIRNTLVNVRKSLLIASENRPADKRR